MSDRTPPQLDLAVLLAAKFFDEDDLAQNRRGVLSAKQESFRAANPRFMDESEGPDGAVETLVGRVAIEGAYVAGRMGETVFADLALPGRRLALHPSVERRLVRGAPYRAYAAYGWIWSLEPITEDELLAKTAPAALAPYRAAPNSVATADIARALEEALSIELSFSPDDLAANRSGRFSRAQRGRAAKQLVFATFGSLVSSAALWGLIALLNDGAPFPVFATISGLIALVVFLGSSVRSLVDALARLVKASPLRTLGRLDTDPTNRDNFVLENEGPSIKIKRAAIAISEAPFSVLRQWRFELYLAPWTRSVIAVRPVPPSE